MSSCIESFSKDRGARSTCLAVALAKADVACYELLALFVVERVTEPDAETGVILRQALCHVIVSDELSLVERREHPFSEGFLDSFEVYLSESAESTILPVAVSEESVQVRVIVQRLTCRLHRKDGSELTLVYPKDLLEGSPGSTEQDGIEFAVVLKEDPRAFWDGKDGVAMGDIFDDFAVDVLCELHCPFRSA